MFDLVGVESPFMGECETTIRDVWPQRSGCGSFSGLLESQGYQTLYLRARSVYTVKPAGREFLRDAAYDRVAESVWLTDPYTSTMEMPC